MVNFNPIDQDYLFKWQSDLENTKESILPVCDKPYHKIKENLPHWEGLDFFWNYALPWRRLWGCWCSLGHRRRWSDPRGYPRAAARWPCTGASGRTAWSRTRAEKTRDNIFSREHMVKTNVLNHVFVFF